MSDIATARGWVRDARRIVLLSGAGMSAESGVPTFRDAQTGLWANFRPEDLATEDAFRARPGFVNRGAPPMLRAALMGAR